MPEVERVERPLNLSFRVATAADLPVLNQLYAAMDGEGPMDGDAIATLFDRMQQIPEYDIYLAEQADISVGTFTLLMIPTMMHRGIHRSALLDSVTVLPDWRSRGIGRAMMAEAMRRGREGGCYKLMLSSNLSRERAHAFYESLGFQQHGWSFSLKL